MATSRLLIVIGSLTVLLNSADVAAFNGFGSKIDAHIKESADRYQISEAMLRGLVKIEDGWYGKVSPTGATGVGQFTIKTWNWLANSLEGYNIGMRPITAVNKNTRYDPRKNTRINTLATGLYARWHVEQFKQRGIKLTDANLYLAHNIGLDGLYRALIGKSTKEDILNMRRNGMKRDMTVKEFIAYQTNRYNTHKSLANAQHQNSSSNALIAKNSKKLPPNAVNRPRTAPTNSTLRWVEPTNHQTIWIAPTQNL